MTPPFSRCFIAHVPSCHGDISISCYTTAITLKSLTKCHAVTTVRQGVLSQNNNATRPRSTRTKFTKVVFESLVIFSCVLDQRRIDRDGLDVRLAERLTVLREHRMVRNVLALIARHSASELARHLVSEFENCKVFRSRCQTDARENTRSFKTSYSQFTVRCLKIQRSVDILRCLDVNVSGGSRVGGEVSHAEVLARRNGKWVANEPVEEH